MSHMAKDEKNRKRKVYILDESSLVQRFLMIEDWRNYTQNEELIYEHDRLSAEKMKNMFL